MTDNVIKFKKHNISSGNNVSDKVALENYEILKNILKTNIEILNDPDEAWFILATSPFDFENKPDILGYVCGYYQGRLQALLDYLNKVQGSYLTSHLVNTLDVAISLMEADHITRIQIWSDDNLTTLVLHRTFEVWGVVNLFVNGESIHDCAVRRLLNTGKTNEDLFQWKKTD